SFFADETKPGKGNEASLRGTTAKDLNKEGGLLAQREIRAILFMDVLFSVRLIAARFEYLSLGLLVR
ncbi:hypothetical protein, partial [Parasphingorhabdus sp.]